MPDPSRYDGRTPEPPYPTEDDKKRDTQDFIFRDILVSHCGKQLTPELVDQVVSELTAEATTGGCAWAFD